MSEKSAIINTDKKQINLMVRQLFDGNLEELNHEFSNIDPIMFYNETIKEKEKHGYHGKIAIPCNYLVDKSELVLNKIEEARKSIIGSQFDELWNCFDINLDFSIWGSSIWEPRVLPNGSLLIRNIQKIIGINEQVSLEVNTRSSNIKNDLKDLITVIENKNLLNDEDTLNFSILHRDENGFIWTRHLPEFLSEVGQTLIFISKDIILKLQESNKINPNNIFINDKVLEIAEKSVSEHCVFRIFKYSTFLYGTYRLGDEYDTILENYSYRLGNDPINNDFVKKEIHTDFNFSKNYIKQIVQKEKPEIYDTDLIKNNRTIKVLLIDKISEEYTSKKAWQIDKLQPIFGHYWDRPASYYDNNSKFWNVSQLNKGYMFVVNFNFYHLPSSRNALQDFKDSIEKVISQADNKLKALLYLPITELSYLNEEDVFEYGTEKFNNRIKLISKELTKKHAQTITFEELANYENEELATKEFSAMSGSEYKVYVLFVSPTAPIIKECHQFGISLSKFMDVSLTIHIPNYGFNQDYSSGNLVEGNSSQYLVI